ncbi:hypothetical protein BV898_06578 [Hypsibius exemplaris]|uniref:Uncharacterized protein n=1 Tax=Hypsibius exemplaris TaxID=2072580 RepID=A0A1W0WW25_HYPEX|nr:hypothetical protein BV898_06578 [Hypsibius exemplaris]
MPASMQIFMDFGDSTKDLIDALAEMDAIIAESKYSLDTMSLSTTSTSTPKLSDDTPKTSPIEDSHNNPSRHLSATTLSSAINAIKYTNGHRREVDISTNGYGHHLTDTKTEPCHQRNGAVSPLHPASVMGQLAEEMRMQIELSDGFPGQMTLRVDKDTLRVLKQWIQTESASSENEEVCT